MTTNLPSAFANKGHEYNRSARAEFEGEWSVCVVKNLNGAVIPLLGGSCRFRASR